MGLRFRKSVSLCKGVKLNFSKTGMSVSLGTKGYHKTISTSGRVTTTVGLPGTGIYYTDTKKIGGQKQNRSTQPSRATNGLFGRKKVPEESDLQRYDELVSMDSIYDNESEYVDIPEASRSVDRREVATSSSGTSAFSELIDIDSSEIPWDYSDSLEPGNVDESKKINLTEEDIKNIYRYCDATIEWTEILGGATADELLINPDVWQFCKKIAPDILSGNIDAYLKAIEELRPVDDLLLYSGNFEFGTDKPSYIEVEFSHNANDLLDGGVNNSSFENLIAAISIRVARDLMALLSVNKVVVHVVEDNITVMSGIYDRSTLNKCSNMEIGALISKFEHSVNRSGGRLGAVERLLIK